jgi:hypothetical protein
MASRARAMMVLLEMAIVEEAWWLICGVRLLDRDREVVALPIRCSDVDTGRRGETFCLCEDIWA